MTRKASNKLLEMIEEGTLDRDTVILACLKYMSEDDVLDMMRSNEMIAYCDDCGDDMIDADPGDINVCDSCMDESDTEEEDNDPDMLGRLSDVLT